MKVIDDGEREIVSDGQHVSYEDRLAVRGTLTVTSEDTVTVSDDLLLNIPDNRNIDEAEGVWDSSITINQHSNVYGLLESLFDSLYHTDETLEAIYDAQHINSANGKNLDNLGNLVGVERKSNERDVKYRARIKAEFAQGNISGTYDEFVEYAASVLSTDIQNLEIFTNYTGDPATVVLAANPSIYDSVALTNTEVADLLGGGVAAGHEVKVQEKGTFRLKSDGEIDDPDKGLTSDSISTGGTLAADLV